MDILDRIDAKIEAKREAIASTARVGSAALADGTKPKTDMPAKDYPITIIGCIRGVDSWYQAGYDQRKRSIIPMQMIQRRSIFSGDDCPMCANSDPETNTCYEASTIRGGTPCIYWRPRENQ